MHYRNTRKNENLPGGGHPRFAREPKFAPETAEETLRNTIFRETVSGIAAVGTWTQENDALDDTTLIQQYLQFRSEFMGYLYAMTRDAGLSEEVYQNAAVVVMEQSQKTETIRNFRAWAKEVVRRQALHAIRARAVAAKHARAISPELLDAVSDAFLQDESEYTVVRDEARALKRCLDKLPEDKRELVAMRYEDSSGFDEISEHVGSTPAAVQRALSRVRKMLHGCVQRRMQLAEGAS